MRLQSLLAVSLAVSLVVAACATPSGDRPKSEPDKEKKLTVSEEAKAGELPVGAIPTGVVHDAQRNRDIEVVIEYPTRGGPFPVIIFSHGYGSSKNGYTALTEYWTSHGFVCIKPSHADAGALADTMRDLLAERREERRERRRSGQTPQPPQPPPPSPMETMWEKQTEADYRNRVRDVTAVIDALGALEQQYPELKGKMDTKHIGVGGHSYGAFTAMMVAGMKVTKGGATLRLGDPRVGAVIAMSPQGVSPLRGIAQDSWSEVKVPVLYMTGTRDNGATEAEDYLWRRGAYDNSPAGDKWLVILEGATHMSFTGVFSIAPEDLRRPSTAEPTDPRLGQATRATPRAAPEGGRRSFATIEMATLRFWEAYPKEDAKAKDLLSGMATPPAVIVEKK